MCHTPTVRARQYMYVPYNVNGVHVQVPSEVRNRAGYNHSDACGVSGADLKAAPDVLMPRK